MSWADAIVTHIRSRLLRRARPVRAGRQQLADARAASQAWKDTADQYRRRILSASVIREMFDLRMRTLPARVSIASRDERESVLRAVSPDYVSAVARGPAIFGEHVHRMSLQGLQWWMPVVRPQPDGPRKAWITKQRFPYQALTQTREVALGGIMLDLGANIGRMSIPRVVLGDVSAAYCAEPDPLNYACLVGNIVGNGLDGLLLPDHVAISDRAGTVRLRRANVSGGHRVLPPEGIAHASDDIVEVPAFPLDTWIARLRVDPDAVTFVKVDVQGFEMRVLQGAPSLLTKRHIAWQLELDPELLAAAGSSLADVCALLERHFVRFIDMNSKLLGPRQRPIEELSQGLAYLGTAAPKTDILVY
jgi:FkbM family methyltransferase